MTCNKSEEHLLGYLYATVSYEEHPSLKEHISHCDHCWNYLKNCENNLKKLMKLKELLKKCKIEEPSPELKKNILMEAEKELQREINRS